ncbi:hypothetical protein [Leptolyngbya sp. 7M]|uniref:hypothetical protein n=1 Tax=Leptolyngbya sp. 7M TaxID=2812896 RepID=UPI001B8C6581|nr:hypothetical protein [Leptolyngbya sp. 7M]QYO65213.1 hypothetical protein JVX88_00050 [Leptolyngbya sp. 7M]
MFIKAGPYTINTDNVSQVTKHGEDEDVLVTCVGSETLSLRGEAAEYFIRALTRTAGL